MKPLTTNQYLGTLQALLLLTLLGMVAWFLYHTHTAVPHGDDFCYGIKVSEHGVLGAVWNEYIQWGGRFTSATLISIAMQGRSLITYNVWIIPLLILLALYVSVHLFTKRLGITSWTLVLALYVALVASINWWESLLWLSGGITYGLSFVLFLVLLGFEIHLFISKGGSIPSVFKITLYGLLSVVLAGFNEVIAVTHFALLGLCLIVLLQTKMDKARVQIFIFLLACAFIGLLIVNFAPGNDVRMTFLSKQMLVSSLIKSFLLFFDQCMVAIIISMLFFGSIMHLFRFSMPTVELTQIRPWVLMIPLSIMAAIFVRMYTGGSLGPLRAQSIDFVLSTVEGLLLALLCYQPSTKALAGVSPLAKDTICFVLALILIALFPSPDGKWWYTLRQQYADTRYQQFLQPYLEQSSKNPDSFVTIPRFDTHELKPGQRRPRTIWDGDFTNNPQDWTNQCFSKFYRLRGMQVVD
jgi:hypothetical protein